MSTLAADRLFWSVIDARGVRPGALPSGLWPLIEDDLPMDPSLLWAVGSPLDDDRFAVCAVRRVDLGAAAGALTLTPHTVPDFIPAPPSSFNFLIGEYEPAAVRRARFRLHLAGAACTLLAASLAALGLARRAAVWKSEFTFAKGASQVVIDSVAPAAGWTKDDLALELLQRHQAGPPELSAPADAAEALARIFTRWPTQLPSRPQSISATGTAASISVTIPGDAQSFLAAFKPPEGWTLDEPRLASADKTTRLNLELHRKGAP